MVATSDIARLRLALDEVEPAVMRRIEVPLGIGLDRLHAVLQVAVGWTNSHLWEFRAGDVAWGVPDPGRDEGPRDARKATLLTLLEQTGVNTLTYLYDFGDGWEHQIKVQHIGPAQPGEVLRLLAARGCCPPEDIGGPPGYAEFLEAMADPGHARHDELTEWHGGSFDSNAVDANAIQRQLAQLAKRWARSATKRSRKPA